MARSSTVARVGSRFLAAAGVLFAASLGTGTTARADEIINSAGPIKALHLGEDLSCQVSYGDPSFEFYPPAVAPGDCGAFLVVDGTLYAPDFQSHETTATSSLGSREPFTAVEQTGVTGSGSGSDPFAVETLARAGGSGVSLRQRVTYVIGSPTFRVDLTATNITGAPKSTRIFYAGDCYASGSDIGYGFTRPEIGSVGCSQNPNNVPAARTIQFSPLSAGSSFTEDRFAPVWEQISEFDAFDNLCLCSTSVDNGAGLSWEINLAGNGSSTRSLEISFTEATPSTAPADSDGDALPDAWETGSGGASDATNLAPLGADPSRKDIFVHADYMQGCEPDPGWERQAIDMFKRQGIALHVDSGPLSLNDDGQPWGERSRAGDVPLVEQLPMEDGWGPVDRIKDQRFVPSNRRRAFHYALFAKAFSTRSPSGTIYRDDGGVSRGIPDSDVLIANCGRSPRGDAVLMAHELGHNLGLRHGGADDINDKPNHHSLMNYSWALSDIPAGRLTSFSPIRRTDIDESQLTERDGLQTPAIWWCLDSERSTADQLVFYPQRIDSSGVRYDLDLDCDGTTGEPAGRVRHRLNGSYISDVNKDKGTTTLVGHNDWGALQFSGAGVIGALDLPARNDTPPVPELTSGEIAANAAASGLTRRRTRKQLVVRVSKRRVRRARRTKLAIRVLVNGKPVRRVRVRVNGARVVRRPGLRGITNRRGRATIVVRPRAKRWVTVAGRRKGFRTGSAILGITRGRRNH